MTVEWDKEVCQCNQNACASSEPGSSVDTRTFFFRLALILHIKLDTPEKALDSVSALCLLRPICWLNHLKIELILLHDKVFNFDTNV